jgi:hypothetical protein
VSERKTNEAEIQRIVRYVMFDTPSNEVFLRKESRNWSAGDFLYALERLGTDLNDQPQEMRERLRGLYRTLLNEREAAEARMILEAANADRHTEIFRQLEELKKPHWSIVPNFWMTAAILVLTLIGVIAAILALRH